METVVKKKAPDLTKFTWRDIVAWVAYFGIQIGFVLIGTIIVSAILMASGSIDPTATDATTALMEKMGGPIIWITTLASLMTFIVIGWMYRTLLIDQWKKFWEKWKINIPIVVIGYISIIVLNLVVTMVLNIESSANQESLEQMFNSASLLQLILLQVFTVLFAPITEEILCRKILFGNFKDNKIAAPIMFVVSSVVFGFLHYGFDGQFLSLLPYILMGAVFAAAYWKTNNLFVAIGIHFLNNFIATIILVIFSFL